MTIKTNKRLIVLYAMVGAALSAAMVSYLDPTSELSKNMIPTASAIHSDEYFLKIDGVTGEATNPVSGETGWIAMEEFHTDVKCVAFGGGGAGAQRCPTNFTGTDMITSASPQILKDYQQGRDVKTIQLMVVSSNGDNKPAVAEMIEWRNAAFKDYQINGNSGDTTETFSFDAKSMQLTVGAPVVIPPLIGSSTTGQ